MRKEFIKWRWWVGLVFLLILGGVSPANAQSWSNGYAFRRAITIDHTKVPNTDQTNFPVLVSGTYSFLATTSNGGGVTNSKGYDINFTSDAAGTNFLPYERESYSSSTGTASFWIQISTLSHTSDTVIYVFYGNAAVTTDQSNKASVWDASYLGIWHLSDNAASTTIVDSKGGHDGTNAANTNAKTTAGKIGGALQYGGSSDYSSIAIDLSGTNKVMLEFWLYWNAFSNNDALAFEYSTNFNNVTTGFLVDPSSSVGGYFGTGLHGSGGYSSAGLQRPSAGAWHSYALVYDKSQTSNEVSPAYIDGVLQTPNYGINASNSGNFGNLDLYLMSRAGSSLFGSGNLDEVRISNSLRSADWIATEFHNESSPTTFYSVGSVVVNGLNGSSSPYIAELAPAAGPVAASVSILGANFGATQGSSTVTFNGTAATPTAWTDSSIVVPVPTGATSGSVLVSVSGTSSNAVTFTVTPATTGGYAFQRTITIDHTKVPNSDQANFPLLISGTYSFLANTANGGNVTSPYGYDIIFTSDAAGMNLLPFEQDSYSATTGAINYWVQVPNLSHTTNTVIYMSYGNGAVTADQSNRTGVWDSNYQGVWHLGNGLALSASDSTGYANSGTVNGNIAATAGKINGAASAIGGTNNGIATPNFITSDNSPFTYFFWVNSSGGGTTVQRGQDGFGNGWSANVWFNSNAHFSIVNSSPSQITLNGNATISNGTWYNVAAVWAPGSGMKLYVNGALDNSNTNSSTMLRSSTKPLQLLSDNSNNSFNGLLDEVQISSVARSGDWIAAEYNNQNSPSTFYSVGAQAVIGSGGGTAPYIAGSWPASGPVTSPMTIFGVNFGSTQGSSTVTFNGTSGSPNFWSDSTILVSVPATATSGNVVVTVSGTSSNPSNFTVTTAPGAWSTSPTSGVVGMQVAIIGINFGSTQGSSTVTLNGLNCSVVSWSNTSITVVVPSGAASGPFTVSVGTQTAKSPVFTVTQIPTGWFDQDIGTVGVAGSASYANSTFTVNGAGGGTIATAADGINFMYQPLSGDGTIVARVVTAQGGGSQEAGVMIRETLSPGATNAETFYFAGNSQDFNITERTTTGATTSSYLNSQAIAASLPYWVKLTRSGTSFTGYVSADGVYWTQIGSSQTISMAQNVYIGLFVTNRSTSAAATATFDNVSVTSAASPAPSITTVSATTGAVGNQVVISGQNFGSSQGSSTVLVNGIAATINSWSSTSITMTVPTSASTGYLAVAVAPTLNSSNPVWFQVTSQPLPSGWLDRDIGYGSMFSQRGVVSYANSTFTVQASGTFISGTADAFHYVYQPLSGDGTILARVTGVNNGEAGVMIRETLDPASTMAYVRFTPSNAYFVTRTSSGASASQQSSGFGASGTPYWLKVTRSGNTFSAFISLDGVYWTQVSTSQTISMTTNVYAGLAYSDDNTGSAGSATFDSGAMNSGTPPGTPNVTSVSPTVAGPGYSVTISGSGFGATQGSSQVYFNGTAASSVTSWSSTQIVATVPSSASTGPVTVVVGGVGSNQTVSLTIYNLSISTLTPPAAQPGGTITITGSGFAANQNSSTVSFNGVNASTLSWSNTSISVTVPSSATTGPVTVTEGGIPSNGVQFTVLEPIAITSISPLSGPVGTTVTITGAGFGPTQSNSTMFFYGALAGISTWSDTQIVATVPSGASSGPVGVTVGGQTGTGPSFLLTTSAQVTDSLGNPSTYNTAVIGGMWVLTSATGSGCSSCTVRGTIQNTYDGNGNVLTRTDELGRTTTYTYDSNNNVASVSVPLGNGTNAVTSYTFNSFGEVLTATDPLGNVTTNTYDTNGNLTKVTTPVPGTGASASVTTFAYNSLGELTSITDPLNNATALTYTSTGLIATITDAQNNVTTYAYDGHGNRTSVTDALNHTTSFAYDSGDRLTKITYPDTTTTQFGYDYRGRRTSVTDQNGKITSYVYDDADRLTSVTDAASNVTTYGYDTENNLTSIQDANNHTTNFAYDAFGRVTQTTFPSSAVETYSYDAVGNLTGKTDRKNQSITYTYDQLNRLTQKTYPDNSTVNYTYDNDSRLTQVNDPTGTYSFTFDNMGRLTGTTTQYAFLTGRSFTAAYSYDAASNRIGFTDPEGGSTAYMYDTLNRLQTLTPPAAISGGSFGFSYDALSRRNQMTRPNGVASNYSYDNLSRLLSVLHQTGTTAIDGATYTLDNAGNRTAKTDQRTAVATSYGYDNIYQLLSATPSSGTAESYTYDAVGNRLSSAGVPSYSYNSSNELTSTSSASYGFDLNGNALTKNDSTGITTYAWDFENRLASVTLPGSGGTVSFSYDPFGRRIKKSSSAGTSIFAYNGDNLIEETNASGVAVARYSQTDEVDEPLAMLRSSATSFYNADGLGTITSLASGAGSLAQTYTFDSFGKQTASTGSLTNPFQFTGREFDSETSLYFMRARYFDPATGRFINEDPAGFDAGSPNFYAYVANDPIDSVDPFGLKCIRKLILITAYSDPGPGKDWPYFAPKKRGGKPGGAGPGIVAVANSNPQPYPFGSGVSVSNTSDPFGSDNPVAGPAYCGNVHDTGAGWDPKHHNVPPEAWIDIWLPRKQAIKWGKQWRWVTICTPDTPCGCGSVPPPNFFNTYKFGGNAFE